MEYVEAQETAEYSFLKNFRQLVTLERQKVPTAYLKSQKGNGRVAQTKGPRQDAGTRNPSITFLRYSQCDNHPYTCTGYLSQLRAKLRD